MQLFYNINSSIKFNQIVLHDIFKNIWKTIVFVFEIIIIIIKTLKIYITVEFQILIYALLRDLSFREKKIINLYHSYSPEISHWKEKW